VDFLVVAFSAAPEVATGSSEFSVAPGTLAFAAAIVSSIAAAIASVAAVLQIQSMRRGVQLQDQDGRVSILHDVMNRWSATLPALYEVRERHAEFANADAQFEDVTDFMRSEYWAKLRIVCNFYEFAGLLAHSRALRLETLLVIITVRASDYAIAKAAIDRLRRDYRKDIYLFWDWLDMQCNCTDLQTALRDKRKELVALQEHWKDQHGHRTQRRGGLDPFSPLAKRGL